jgi:hypothetical protein
VNLFDMPTPGPITGAQGLVQAAYKAIQYSRIIAEQSPSSDTGAQLRKFFLDCAKFCPKPVMAEQIQARDEAAAATRATATNTAGGRGRLK